MKKKKKIKDLTLEEIKKFCKNNKNKNEPVLCDCVFKSPFICPILRITNDELEQEIEVEE